VQDESGGYGCTEREEDEGEDEKSCLFACLFRWPGDAEGIDERVGEEVEEAHSLHYAPMGLMQAYRSMSLEHGIAGSIASNRRQKNRMFNGLAAEALRR
jgi:hypothetical protein